MFFTRRLKSDVDGKFAAKLRGYIKKLKVMSQNCKKLPECKGLSSHGVDIKCAIPNTLCTTEAGREFLLKKLGELIPEKTFIERLESFYYEERIRLRRKFEEMKKVTERFLKQINEKFYATKTKMLITECMFLDSMILKIYLHHIMKIKCQRWQRLLKSMQKDCIHSTLDILLSTRGWFF